MKSAGGGVGSTPALAHGRRRVWLSTTVILLASVIGALLWHTIRAPDPGFVEYRMPVKTDIPTALAVAPDGAIWFTLEFSDAIGVFRSGRIERLSKGTQNLEPLGLAVDGEGHAWYTDTPARVISRIAPDGAIRSFPLRTPVVRLGRLALGPDGAVWFADGTMSSLTRLEKGVFVPHAVRSLGASPFGVAVDAQGTVWTTLQGVDKLARLPPNGQVTELDVPTRQSGLGDVTVDRIGAVWFVELRVNQIGRFADGRFDEFPVPTPSAGLISLAAAPDGAVWFTELRAGQLGRLRDGRMTEFRVPRDGARPFGVAVDAANNVWYTDLSGWLGMLPAASATSR